MPDAAGARAIQRWNSAGIDELWVLTAAHCVEGLENVSDRLFVKVGATNIKADGSLMTVRSIIIHEKFVPDAGLAISGDRFDYDIALLELFNEATLPAESIPLYVGDPDPGEPAIIVGWGTTRYDLATMDSSRSSIQLLEAQVTVISQTDCNVFYENEITDNMICAGDIVNGGVDSCQGDSGGPMMLAQDGGFRQIGIVSFGVGCGLPHLARIFVYQDFLPVHGRQFRSRFRLQNKSQNV